MSFANGNLARKHRAQQQTHTFTETLKLSSAPPVVTKGLTLTDAEFAQRAAQEDAQQP